MKEIRENLFWIECTTYGHAYLIRFPERAVMIDTGSAGLADKMLSECRDIGLEKNRISDILLTHHDVDHIGNAKDLREKCGATVWAHEKDLPYINGKKRRPGIKRLAEIFMSWKMPIIDRLYNDNQTIYDSIRIIHSPGHTPGHVSIFWQDVLLCGDLIVTRKSGEISLLPRIFTWDREILKRTIRELGKLDFNLVCPAHGIPVLRENKWEKIYKS